MAYKDKDRQRQANKEASKRYRAKQGMTLKCKPVILEHPPTVIPAGQGFNAAEAFAVPKLSKEKRAELIASGYYEGEDGIWHKDAPAIPNYGQPDCQCMHCQQNRANGSRTTISHGAHKTVVQLAKNEVNRVPLPGDADYAGVADNHPEWPRVVCG